MAGAKIRGITIELGADASGIQKALKGIDSQLKSTQNQLKDVNKLLQLDPKNTELLTQKQKNLENAIDLTKQRLNELKDAQSGVEKGSAEWDALQREIIETEGNLKNLQKQYRDFGSVASQQIKAVGQQMQDAGSKVSGFGQKLAPISGAASALGGALLKLGYDAVTGADDLNTLSKQTGISTDELQRMQYASDLVDVSVEDITGALRKMKSNMDGQPEAWERLGVATTNADGSMRDATDVFYDAIKALSEVSNETERDQLAMDIFGKSADSLAGIIDDGGKALKEYGDQAEDLGLLLDGKTLDSLNETNDTIDEMKAQIRGTMAVIGSKVVPVVAPLLTKVADLIGKVSDKLGKLTPKQTDTIMKITGIVAAVAPLLVVGGKLISGIGSLISIVGSVVGVLGGPLTIAIGAVIAAGVLLYKNWDTVKATAQRLRDGVATAFQNMKDKISSALDGARSKIDSIKSKFDELKNKVSTIVSNIKSALSFNWSFPKLKLPHISVSYRPAGRVGQFFGFDSIPQLSVAWYRKAYDNPVMFTQPTVLQTPSGMKGFGDGHGAEIVMGLEKLRELVGSEREQPIYITVQSVLDGKVVGESVTRYQRNAARAWG